jgi:hypothetical protein
MPASTSKALTFPRMMIFFIAFQNGFFWKEQFDQKRKDFTGSSHEAGGTGGTGGDSPTVPHCSSEAEFFYRSA